MTVVPLRCTIQHYAWGSRTSIPKLVGASIPQDEPWAELWMGAHPKAPSRLPKGESLADAIAADPLAMLGPSAVAKGHTALPFLFKILAAEGPLSIQCHPTKKQAEAGFAAEDAAGIPRDAPNRNYRDANHKPELIVALEEFWALKGFRDPNDIADLFGRANMTSAEPLLALLAGPEGIKEFFSALLALDDQQTKILLGELARGLGNLPEAEARWSQGLLARYPNDHGAMAALVLQLVRLEAGQGLFLDAGEPHAYLRGTGLEIMANSDNVIRGGLTRKHVAPQELMKVLRFEHKPVQILEAQSRGLVGHFETPCDEFHLSRLSLAPGQSTERRDGPTRAEIWLSTGGEAELAWNEGSLVLRAGEVAFVSADTGSLTARPASDTPCELWIAGSNF